MITFLCWTLIVISTAALMKFYHLSPKVLMKIFFHTIKDNWYGPLLFIAIYLIRPIFLFPAWILYALSGVVYGFWGGFLFTLVGASISAMVAFTIGRYFAKDMNFEGRNKFMETWRDEIEKNGFAAVLIMRLLYLPFDVVNYGAALLNVGWKPFLAATALSMIVDTGAFISFGATLKNVDSFELSQIHVEPYQLLISAALLILSFVIALLVHRHHHHKQKTHANRKLHS